MAGAASIHSSLPSLPHLGHEGVTHLEVFANLRGATHTLPRSFVNTCPRAWTHSPSHMCPEDRARATRSPAFGSRGLLLGVLVEGHQPGLHSRRALGVGGNRDPV